MVVFVEFYRVLTHPGGCQGFASAKEYCFIFEWAAKHVEVVILANQVMLVNKYKNVMRAQAFQY